MSSRRCKHSAKRSFWGKLKKWWLAEKHHRNFSSSGFRFLYRESVFGTKISGDSRSIVRYHMYGAAGSRVYIFLIGNLKGNILKTIYLYLKLSDDTPQ